ncbi:hypothetical protein CANARDRAFT_232149 [[Candida] arabinofermentans NRRL YB-2248]|uniref:protoporphyrinogen oxidase n=1 Tax=[Candida] arabinofermentans NRRL YB-2248 TaxID=983967 RepID=A0A1E4T3Z2_9ASCO|nr:hypothetical protein CANARDRAFT_232149 [[Candida] arabinofermentans NRRL YB-2248]
MSGGISLPVVHSEIPFSADSSLGNHTVNLPTNISKTIKGFPLSDNDFDVITKTKNDDPDIESHLTWFGDIFKLKNKDSIINKLSYRVLGSSNTLTLSPLLLNNSLNLQFRSLTFKKPLFMKSIDPFSLVISLNDGGLLKLSRETISSDILVIPFSDSSYLNGFGFNFFKRKSTGTIPDHIEINNEKVSSKSIISLTHYQESLITLSIDKKLKFWSLKDLSLTKQFELNDYLPNELHDILLNSIPLNFLQLINDEFVSISLPIGKNHLQIFKIDSEFNISLIHDIQPTTLAAGWIFQDYKISFVQDSFKIWMLWRSNSTSCIKSCQVLQDKQILWTDCATDDRISVFESNQFYESVKLIKTPEELNNYYLSYIFDTFNYNDIILHKVISLFSKHYNLNVSKLPLRQQVIKIVEHNLIQFEYLSNLKTQWMKFDNACKELSKQFQEPISITFNNDEDQENTDFVIIMKSYEYSFIKSPSHLVYVSFGDVSNRSEISSQGSKVDSNALFSLINIVKSFKSSFSSESLSSIQSSILSYDNDTESIDSQMSKIFESEILGQINQSITEELLSALNTIPDVMDLFEYLYYLPTANNVGYIPIREFTFGNLGESILASSIRSEVVIGKELISGLLLILLTVDINDKVIELYSKFFKLFKSYYSIELNSITSINKNLVVNYLKFEYNGGCLIRSSNINYLINTSIELIMNDNFIFYVISKMISFQLCDKAFEFSKYLPISSPISKVLKGLTLMGLNDTSSTSKSYEIFTESMDQVTSYSKQLTDSEKKVLSCNSNLTNLIFTESQIDYFYDLCTLYQSKNLNEIALKLALKAMEVKHKKDGYDDQLILTKVFQLSLKLNEFKLCYETISQMNFKDRKYPLKQFIYKLFQLKLVSKITEFNFIQDFEQVDSLIYELGESRSLNCDLKTSLKYYRTCYTIRLKHGDFRASASALYRFNCIGFELYKLGKFNDLNLLIENYLIILNLLNTMKENDDQFITRRFNKNISDNIVSALMHGVYAGDVGQLSIKAIMPKLVEIEKSHGSIILYFVKQAFNSLKNIKKNEGEALKLNDTLQKYTDLFKPSFSFLKTSAFLKNFPVLSLNEGLENLPMLIAKNMPSNVEIIKNCNITSIEPTDEGVKVDTESNGSFQFDHLRSTINLHKLANIIPNDTQLSERLKEMKYANVVLANVFIPHLKELPLSGFGFLVPKSMIDETQLLGVIFDSDVEQNARRLFFYNDVQNALAASKSSKINKQKLDEVAKLVSKRGNVITNSYTKVTLMIGGYQIKSLDELPSRSRVRKTIRDVLYSKLYIDLDKYKGEHIYEVDYIVESIPQYGVGYLDLKQDCWTLANEQFDGRFSFGGMALGDGVGVPDCIMNSFKDAVSLGEIK